MTAAPGPRYIRADVVQPRAVRGYVLYRVEWSEGTGWVCTCEQRACEHLDTVKATIKEDK